MPTNEETIFEQALAIHERDRRTEFLRSACGENTALKLEIESLLCAYEQSDYLESFRLPLDSLLSTNNDGVLVNTQVGEYDVLELLGEGGMGEVYLAKRRTPRSHELVALKVLKAGMDSHQLISRFRLEQESLKQLDHPHIAKFLESGVTENGRAFFAMELVRGRPLTEYCDRERLNIEERVQLIIEACHAVSHAHQNGIVHRDLKPSNLLVGGKDGIRALKVIDFGVAKAVGGNQIDHSVHTRATHCVGTPGYMSPEQVEGSAEVDERTDVFSLGAVLYALIAGTTPVSKYEHEQYDFRKVTSQVSWMYWQSPSQRIAAMSPESDQEFFESRSSKRDELVQRVSGALDWIVIKALSPDRENRYESPSVLAGDLTSYLEHRPIAARGPSIHERFSDWHFRNKSLAEWAKIVFIATIAASLSVWAMRSLPFLQETQRDIASSLPDLATKTEENASHEIAAGLIQLAYLHHQRNEFLLSQANLSLVRSEDLTTQSLQFAVGYLKNRLNTDELSYVGHEHEILDMDVSPDDRWIASGDKGGHTLIWDRKLQKELLRLPAVNAEVLKVRFSPDGKLLATACSTPDLNIRLWNVSDWSLYRELTGHEKSINGLSWSPDSNKLATGDRDGVVRVWTTADGLFSSPVQKETDVIQCLAWSTDGQWLAAGINNQGIRLTNLQDKETPSRFIENGGQTPLAVAFSPNGQWMAFGGRSDLVTIYDTTNHQFQRKAVPSDVSAITFIDDMHFLYGTKSGQLNSAMYRGLDWTTMQSVDLDGDAGIRSIVATIDGSEIYIATQSDHLIRSICTDCIVGYKHEPMTRINLVREPNEDYVLEFQPRRKSGNLYRADSMNSIWKSPPRHVVSWTKPFASSDQIFIGTFRDAKKKEYRIDVLDLSGELINAIRFPGALTHMSLSRDGKYIVGVGWSGQTHVWDVKTLENWKLSDGTHLASSDALFAPTEDILVISHKDKCSVFRSGNWDSRSEIEIEGEATAICYSPKGSWLAVADDHGITAWTPDMSHKLWNIPSRLLPVDWEIAIAISADESAIAAYCANRTIRIWDTKSRRELVRIPVPQSGITRMEFSDPWTLSVYGESDSIRINAR